MFSAWLRAMSWGIRAFWVGVVVLAVMWLSFFLPGRFEDQKQKLRPVQSTELPRLAVDISQTSVSGISSGAYMAGQFQFAHGRHVVGAGIIAGGPYGCSESAFSSGGRVAGGILFNASKAINGCMLNAFAMFGIPNPVHLAQKARKRSEAGQIDAIGTVLQDRVYLFSGTKDRIVHPAIVRAAAAFYRNLGVPEPQIQFVSGIAAGHAFITETQGGACGSSSEPYIVDCDYDQAGALLQHIYGRLAPPGAAHDDGFIIFDQKPFLRDKPDAGMASHAVLYVPRACKSSSARCRVHIAFHGCGQNRKAVGDAFVRKTGFVRWAESNNIVVLFPQVAKSSVNRQGCWDWWGYSGNNFLTREAPQVVAVFQMLQQLSRGQAGVF